MRNTGPDKNNDPMTRTMVVWLMAMTCCALWGSAFACIKTGYRIFSIAETDVASQILFAGTRFLLSGILTVAFTCIRERKVLIPALPSWKYIGAVSVFQTMGQYIFFYISMAHLSGVKGTILDGINPMVAILVAVYVFHLERMTWNKALGCIVGFLGLLAVTLNGETLTPEIHLIGEGTMLIAAICASVASVLMRKFSQHEDPVVLTGYQFILGGLVMIAGGLLAGGRLELLSFWGIPLLIYMAMISAVAFSLWGILLKHNPVSRISVFGFMTQIFGVVISAVVLQEYDRLQPTVLIALGLVCLGIYLTNRK